MNTSLLLVLFLIYGIASFGIVAPPLFFSLFFSVFLEKIVYRATANARLSKQIVAICFLIISLVSFTFWSHMLSDDSSNNAIIIKMVTMFSIWILGLLSLLGPIDSKYNIFDVKERVAKYAIPLLLVPMITFSILSYFLHPLSFAPTGW